MRARGFYWVTFAGHEGEAPMVAEYDPQNDSRGHEVEAWYIPGDSNGYAEAEISVVDETGIPAPVRSH